MQSGQPPHQVVAISYDALQQLEAAAEVVDRRDWGAALQAVARAESLERNPDALSRVVQGAVQGIMAGISFIGAGVILRDAKAGEVMGRNEGTIRGLQFRAIEALRRSMGIKTKDETETG